MRTLSFNARADGWQSCTAVLCTPTRAVRLCTVHLQAVPAPMARDARVQERARGSAPSGRAHERGTIGAAAWVRECARGARSAGGEGDEGEICGEARDEKLARANQGEEDEIAAFEGAAGRALHSRTRASAKTPGVGTRHGVLYMVLVAYSYREVSFRPGVWRGRPMQAVPAREGREGHRRVQGLRLGHPAPE